MANGNSDVLLAVGSCQTCKPTTNVSVHQLHKLLANRAQQASILQVQAIKNDGQDQLVFWPVNASEVSEA